MSWILQCANLPSLPVDMLWICCGCMYIKAHGCMWLWVYWSTLSIVNPVKYYFCSSDSLSLSLSLSPSLSLSLPPSLNTFPFQCYNLPSYTIHNMHTWTGLQLRRQRTKHLVQRLVSIGSFFVIKYCSMYGKVCYSLRLSPFMSQCNCGEVYR